MKTIHVGLAVLVAAIACGATGYARALKALGEKNLIDMCVLMGDYTETAVLLTVNDAHLPYDVPSLMPVP